MFSRGVSLCSIFALAAVAQGGVQVQLVPTPNQASYLPSQVVQVDVKLVQDAGGSDQRIRMVEFDLSDTIAGFLTVTLPLTHDRGTPGGGDDIYFWSFSSLSACASQATFCGFNHFTDDDMPEGVVDTRDKVLSNAYFGLNADAQAQILLPGNGTPVTVGKLQVTMPAINGTYTLNLMNSDDTGLDRGARVDIGFDPHLIWRARNAAPNDVTGGTYSFLVGDIPPARTLVSTVPPFTTPGAPNPPVVPANGALWRTAGNTVRLTFNGAVPALPGAGQVQINELLPVPPNAAPGFGPDLSAAFTFTLESGNTVLKIRNGIAPPPAAQGESLEHRKWYAIRNTGGWAGVANFEAQFPVQAGDSQGTNNVNSNDVLTINSALTCLVGCGDQNRNDIDGDGRVNSTDVLKANAKVTSFAVTRPPGH